MAEAATKRVAAVTRAAVAVVTPAAVAAASEAAAADDVEGKIAMTVRGAIVFMLVFCTMAGAGSVGGQAAPPQASAPATIQTFGSDQEAVAALVEALRAAKRDMIQGVLGPGSEKLLSSGDKYSDAAERQRFLAAYDENHKLVPAAPGQMVLQVGQDDWPFPIPLVQAEGRWHFDSQAGAQELVNRRIGRNEIAAIRTSLAYVDAQNDFFALTRQFAQHLVSSPGKHDG